MPLGRPIRIRAVKLPHIIPDRGTRAMARELQAYQDVVFLATYQVFERFFGDVALETTCESAATAAYGTEVYDTVMLSKPRWYETKKHAARKIRKKIEKRSLEAMARIRAVEAADTVLTVPSWKDPVKAPANDGCAKRCSAWVRDTGVICDHIWSSWIQSMRRNVGISTVSEGNDREVVQFRNYPADVKSCVDAR